MTTSVENISVFKSFFEKQKLTEPNFIDWYRQLHLVLSTEDKENYLEHLILAAPVALPGQQVPHEELKALYSKQAEQEPLQTVREFHACKHEEGQSVSSYVLKMKSYIDNLERLGQSEGFRKTRKINRTKLLRGHGKGKGNMGYAPNDMPFAPKPKTPPPKKDNPAMDAICHQCGKIRHWRRNCPVYLAELMKKKKPSQGASTSGALSLYVGDGHRAAVEAIRTYHLELSSGLVIVLNNCHYASSITKVFQKEVENQLKKTIKSLRSDHEGEYMSQEFLDHLNEHRIIAYRTPPYTPQNNDLKASGNVKDLELIQEEDTNPSLDTSLHHEEDDQEINEPQSDINPIRRSTRIRRPTYRLCLYIDAEEHELGDLDYDVWVLAELPPNARTISSKWLFKKKTDMDGAVYVFKACLVAKGFTQTYGV
nr:hypothetical protein [Tanacetum cinerariifolium]